MAEYIDREAFIKDKRKQYCDGGKLMEFKPCPFCGGEVHLVSFGGTGRGISEIEVKCYECRYSLTLSTTQYEPFETDAINVWNRRANDV